MQKNVIIIGAGVMGLGVGWRLASNGARVTILERGAPGREASRTAAGMLAPYAEVEFHEEELLRLGEASQALWPDFAAELETAWGRSIHLDRTGTFVVAVDRDDQEALRRQYDYQAQRSQPVTWCTTAELREREPMLSPYIHGGMDCPGDWCVNNRRLITALHDLFIRAGGEVVSGVEVTDVHTHAGAVTGVLCAGGRTYEAAQVLVAAGAWSRSLRGLEAARPPVRPIKGQMLSVQMEPENPLVRHVIRGPDAYHVPKAGGILVIGATSEEKGFDRSHTAGGVYELLKGSYEVIPGTYELPIAQMWTGFRPGSRDNSPILGGCDVSGLFFATGHYRNGIQQTPITVDGVSAAMLGKEVPELLSAFGVHRFRRRRS